MWPRRSKRLGSNFAARSILSLLLLSISIAPSAAMAKSPRTTAGWVKTIAHAEVKYHEQWSVYVLDLASGGVIVSYNPDLRLIPASNRKLMTFALALEKFGPEFRFASHLGLTSMQRDSSGVLTGSVVLRSAGDPTLTASYMNRTNPVTVLRGWIARLKDLGLTRFRGDFIIDASAFGPHQQVYPDAWDYSYRQHSYAALPTAIALNRNLIQISARPASKPGSPAKLKFYPSVEGLSVINLTRTSSSRARGLEAKFDFEGENLIVNGRVGQRAGTQVVQVPLTRPLDLIRAVVADSLRSEGIRLDGRVRVISDPREAANYRITHVVASHRAPPLPELLNTMMRESDNFISEQLWRAAAYRATGRGDVASARKVEQRWFAERGLPWIEPGYDGSGLSRRNRIASRDQVAVLMSVYNSPYRSYLIDAMPSSGRTGTLKDRTMGGGRGRVRAKTGTLSGVSSLVGFVMDRKGRERYAFSLIGNAPKSTNGRLARRQNQIMEILMRRIDSKVTRAQASTRNTPLKRRRSDTKRRAGARP